MQPAVAWASLQLSCDPAHVDLASRATTVCTLVLGIAGQGVETDVTISFVDEQT